MQPDDLHRSAQDRRTEADRMEQEATELDAQALTMSENASNARQEADKLDTDANDLQRHQDELAAQHPDR